MSATPVTRQALTDGEGPRRARHRTTQARDTIYWARGADGAPLHIDAAARGKDCKASCYDCGAPLIARQGEKRQHTFAHTADTSCSGESAVHALAKYLLATLDRPLLLPPYTIKARQQDVFRTEHRRDAPLFGEPVQLHDITLEQALSPEYRPDCCATIHDTPAGDERLAIEIHFRNQKTEVDVSKIRGLDVSALEIDMSTVPSSASLEEIANAVFEQQPRHWLHYRTASEQLHPAHTELRAEVERLDRQALEFLDNACQLFARNAMLHQPKAFKWPKVRETPNAPPLPYTFRLGRIAKEWGPLTDGYRSLEAWDEQFKAPCPVALTIARARGHANLAPRAFQHAGPHLEVIAFQHPDFDTPLHMELRWHNIQGWISALNAAEQRRTEQRAEAEAKARLAAAQQQLSTLTDPAYWGRLSWPTVTAVYGSTRVSAQPRAALPDATWEARPKGWVSSAVAEGDLARGEPVTVVARPRGTSTPPTTPQRPIAKRKFLLVEFNSSTSNQITGPITLEWAGIEDWIGDLHRQARDLHHQAEAARAVEILDDVGTLALLPSEGRTRVALLRLGIEKPLYPPGTTPPTEKDAPAWRCTPTCWRALAARYCLQDYMPGARITAEDIANSPVLLNLLSLDLDEQSTHQRTADVLDWLRPLAKSGILRELTAEEASDTDAHWFEIKLRPYTSRYLL